MAWFLIILKEITHGSMSVLISFANMALKCAGWVILPVLLTVARGQVEGISKCSFDASATSRYVSGEWQTDATGRVRLKICACPSPGDSDPFSSLITSAVALSDQPDCQSIVSPQLQLTDSSRKVFIDQSAPVCAYDNAPQLFKRNEQTSLTSRKLYLCSSSRNDKTTWRFANVEIEPVGRRIRKTRDVYAKDFPAAVITGLRVEDSEKPVSYEDGVSSVLAGSLLKIRLFGSDFTNRTQVRFVLDARDRGDPCEDLPFTVSVHVDPQSVSPASAVVYLRLPGPDQIRNADGDPGETPAFHMCTVARNNGNRMWVHQGRAPCVQIRTYVRVLPLWLQACFIALLLTLSGLFSGLNLGLMALDRTELKLYENTGTDREKRYAKAIIPVRDHGNFLLCTLLLGNVLVNSTLTILLDDLTSGLVAVIGSTLGIVVLGEIIPQAICSRHGLAIGAHTVWITKFFMLLTFPLSYPISLILDRILGEEIGAYYNRERLKELIKVTHEYHDLEKDEVNIIAGALELRKKTVADIMTRLEDVFMLSIDAKLDFETVSEIMKQGYSRIPVYEGSRSNIVTLLFIKDLAFVDPDDETPLKTLCQFYNNPCNFVFEDTTLDVMFKEFKEGYKGHMAFVQRVNCEGEGDPFYETIGLVTLEDVIEELIQAEIVDETDVYIDNRSRRKRDKGKILQDFTAFAHNKRDQSIHVSPQLALAAYQYLSTTLEAFKPEFISESVLRRLLVQGVVRIIKVKNREVAKSDPSTLIYVQGKPSDYFVLILEGRVEVTVGKENLIFESGSFTHFGIQAITGNFSGILGESPSSAMLLKGSLQSVQTFPSLGTLPESGGSMQRIPQVFVPDYSVRAICDVVYLKISRSLYHAARKATLLESSRKDFSGSHRPSDFEEELDRVFSAASTEDNNSLKVPVKKLSYPQSSKDMKDISLSRRTISMNNEESRQPLLKRGRGSRQISLTSSLPATPSESFVFSPYETKNRKAENGDRLAPVIVNHLEDREESSAVPTCLLDLPNTSDVHENSDDEGLSMNLLQGNSSREFLSANHMS